MIHSSGGSGPVTALKNIAVTLFSTVQTRLALLVNEIQVQKYHALRQLWLALALIGCLALGVLLALGFAVLLWWEHRLLVLGGFSALFIGLAGYFYAALRSGNAASGRLFEHSLAELQEDLRRFEEAAGHEQKPG